MRDPRRSIPSVDRILQHEELRDLLRSHPRALVVAAVRRALDAARHSVPFGNELDIIPVIRNHVREAAQRSLRRVFNATGVILHTNLGRAPLSEAAIAAMADAARGFSNLEYDLDAGARGSRYTHCVALLRELTHAQDALVVNNGAAALVLALSALARDREVVVSRGELVEIGGSFRVPDIMARSGARLVEVGTTNRTHLDDYVRAIGPGTAAIAKIHRSNFALSGFVAEVPVESLRPVAAEHAIPIVHDLGSGLVLDLSRFGLSGEPTAQMALRAGATLVVMSGDKLLGGPQAGIVLGTSHAIARLRKDPLARAFRVDKMTIAALTATLESYRDPQRALEEIPALSMLTTPADSIRARCLAAQSRLSQAGVACEVVESLATVGAGAFPTHAIASFALAFAARPATEIEQKLRAGVAPVIGRVEAGQLLLDMRSIQPAEDGSFVESVIESLG